MDFIPLSFGYNYATRQGTRGLFFDDRPLLQEKSSGARLPPVPFSQKICGRTAGSLSLRQHKGLLLHLHHPLLSSRHERTDLHRDAILWPPHAAPPPTGSFPASVSNGGQQAAEEVMLRTFSLELQSVNEEFFLNDLSYLSTK